MKTLIAWTLVIGSVFPLYLNAGELLEVPTQWRLDDNGTVDPDILVFYSGSTCANGTLRFPVAVFGEQGKQRFWNTVITLKITNKKMRVFYTNDGSCTITMFGLPNDAA